MIHLTSEQARKVIHVLDTIDRNDLDYSVVSGKQIISALLREIGIEFAEGYLYTILQQVASEARERHLLINPNPRTGETYSAAVGNTNRMHPSATGWEQTKGILTRRLAIARKHLITVV